MTRKHLIAIVTPFRESLSPAMWFDTWLPLRERKVEMNLLARLKREMPSVKNAVEAWEAQNDYFCIPLINKHMTNDMQHLSAARNQLVEAARDRQADYIYWVDADMVVKGGSWKALRLLYEVIQREYVDVVSGVYLAKNSRKICAYEWDNKSKTYNALEPWRAEAESLGGTDVFPVDAVGLGCCLMTTKLFSMISRPWFKCDDMYEHYGEDVGFCRRVKDAGYGIYLHKRVDFSHLGIFQLTPGGELEKAI